MKVYVVSGLTELFEDMAESFVAGVFSNKESAKQCMLEDFSSDLENFEEDEDNVERFEYSCQYLDDFGNYIWYEINEFEVQ